MDINTKFKGAYVFSSGKNMGVFKAVGLSRRTWAEFYRLDEYAGYSWTAHGRYPTNTPGWWGGAHPFALLDYSVVHNGEISSYDANRRFIEMFGYKCTLLTDTEVITYIVDYLLRRQGMTLEESGQRHRRAVLEHDQRHSRAEEPKRLTYLRNGVFQPADHRAVLHPARLQRRADGAQRPAEAPLDGRRRRKTILCSLPARSAAIRAMEPDARQRLGARWAASRSSCA